MRTSTLLRALSAATFLAVGCAPGGADEPLDVDTDEPADERTDGVFGGTVGQAVNAACSTSIVAGLSRQIIEEAACIDPTSFVSLPSRPNLNAPSNVNLFLEKPARDRLVAALDANPNRTMTVNSMLRTVAQQYLLYRWGKLGACGIGLAAYPGSSNHETGLAIDIDNWSSWRSTLSSRGFRWFGSSDEVHFDYVGTGATDHRGLDVLAFQRLHNRNKPNDTIAEDGEYGPATESRLKAAPAAGFAKGASCQAPSPTPSTCGAVFVDICTSPHRASIEWLASKNFTSGCDPVKKLYCPDRALTRAELAGFLATALALPAGPDAFTDDEGSPYEGAINALAKAGISSGCGGGEFCPNETVTREELAALFVEAFNLPAGPDAFTDDESSPFESAINAIAAAGITGGCGQGKFCPEGTVTRAEIATFLKRAIE
jgi:hypothetical protein